MAGTAVGNPALGGGGSQFLVVNRHTKRTGALSIAMGAFFLLHSSIAKSARGYLSNLSMISTNCRILCNRV